jgi:hypothetical protein
MPLDITAIAEQYFETIEPTSLTMLADPLDAARYTILATGICARALALAHQAAAQKPENSSEAWLQVRILATLPAPFENIPSDLAAVRHRILDDYIKRQEETLAARDAPGSAGSSRDEIMTKTKERDAILKVMTKSRLAVAIAACGCEDERELTKCLIDVADHAEQLLSNSD